MARLSKSGIVFLALGAALFWCGFERTHFTARILCVSAGVAFLALGLAYIFSRPGFLFKTSKGRIPILSQLLFWPYHLLSYGSFIVFRLARVAPFQEITPGLYLGGWLFPWERHKLHGAQIASVLDLTCELNEAGFLRSAPSYRCIPLLDGTAPTAAQLQAGINFIRERLPAGPVYVHCAMGHGRSVTVVAGYLMAIGAVRDLPSAVKFIREKRPGIRINAAQKKSIELLKL